jgi:CubicO group peptidase (beta-lactamase class C family)
MGYDERRRVAPLPPLSLRAAGALTSTVDDMLRYVAWQVREQDPVVRLTHRPIFGDSAAWAARRPGYTMGYNWQMFRAANGGLRIFQDGAVPGYGAWCVLFPELELGIVVLSNQLDPSAPKRLSTLVDEIASSLDARAPPGP